MLPRFYSYTVSMIILLGLFATSLNFALGFGGIYQFHHGVFYGVGAYATAIMLTKTGVSPWICFAVGPIVAADLKPYYGIDLHPAFKALLWYAPDIPRLPCLGHYLSVALLHRRRRRHPWYSFAGIIPSGTGAYYFTLIVSAISFFIIYKMLKSPFGSALQGIRDNPVRSEMIGVNVRRHQLAALVICRFLRGCCRCSLCGS